MGYTAPMGFLGDIGSAISSFGGGARNVLFGQDPSEVKLPEDVERARQQRAGLMEQYQREMTGAIPSPIEEAIRRQGEANAQRQEASLMGMAAGARGLGSVGALRTAMALGSQARTQTGGQIADLIAQERARREEAARVGLAQMIREQEASALGAEQYRQQMARPGLMPAVLGIGGGIIGGLAGKTPEAAMAGSQLGYGFGSAMGQQFR